MLVAQARPYAKAAFEYAQAEKTVSDWLFFLEKLTVAFQVRTLKKWAANPFLSSEKLVDFLTEVVQLLPPGAKNFMRLLAQRKRFSLLNSILSLFKQYCSSEEAILQVEVKSSIPFSPSQLQILKETLKKRFEKEITISLNVDPGLLGGFLIKAGDQVIDSSFENSLKKLKQALC